MIPKITRVITRVEVMLSNIHVISGISDESTIHISVYGISSHIIPITKSIMAKDTIPQYPPTIPPSILLLIIDLHPLSWSLLSQPPPPNEEGDKIKNASIDLQGFLNVLMVFLNAVLASSGGNQVVVYGATSGRS